MTEARRRDYVYKFLWSDEDSDRLPFSRVIEILSRKTTRIHECRDSYNNYGNFLFVRASIGVGKNARTYTFWGAGENESRGRIIVTWAVHDSHISRWERENKGVKTLPKAETLETIRSRQAEYEALAKNQPRQTRAQRAFSFIADLSDEDAATVELEDNPDLEELF